MTVTESALSKSYSNGYKINGTAPQVIPRLRHYYMPNSNSNLVFNDTISGIPIIPFTFYVGTDASEAYFTIFKSSVLFEQCPWNLRCCSFLKKHTVNS